MPVILATSEAKAGGSQMQGVSGLYTESNVCLGNLASLSHNKNKNVGWGYRSTDKMPANMSMDLGVLDGAC